MNDITPCRVNLFRIKTNLINSIYLGFHLCIGEQFAMIQGKV